MFAVVPGAERQREMAIRFGINLVMYALTGNYKSDQVHVPAIPGTARAIGMGAFTEINFSPALPWPLIAVLAVLAAALLLFAVYRRAPGVIWRGLAFAVGLLALANPSLIQEERDPLNDVALIVVDRSPSQSLGERPNQTDEALAALRKRLERSPNLEVRVRTVGGSGEGGEITAATDGTRLFDTLRQGLGDIPRSRFAGAVVITDGQAHDAPEPAEKEAPKDEWAGPMHMLITGKRDEVDRRIIIESIPSYGIVGQELELRHPYRGPAGRRRPSGRHCPADAPPGWPSLRNLRWSRSASVM